ncbi:hydroxyethylthiazole kinase [Salinicola salarius]|uniref:hydroxyethylthiazole kinase n=1 Tax=Salinicola salarius TaxID=430457 RepID=UPI0023E3E822|nr:hydroxyethylthiazole kinase [Salinicola salarius]MDF3920187.1 hydroxyethylthiazole kinase [Salinicola salarius]
MTEAPLQTREWQQRLLATRDHLRERAPLVHCLTNQVTVNFVANALLAAGASPAMTDHPEEAGDLAAAADAVLINLGTPNTDSLTAMRRASRAANAAGKPWVLDPVGAAALPLRREVSHELMAQHPAVIRGNASEIMALAEADTRGRGVDTQHESRDALSAADDLLERTEGIAISGQVDRLLGRLADARNPVTISLAGGSAWQPRVTGTGCALGALIAAYLAVADTPLDAMICAHAHAAAAAEQAERTARGPGSFAVAWLDALDSVDLAGFFSDRLRLDC